MRKPQILLFILFCGAISFPESLSAKNCPCRLHPAESDAEGACSRTEDEHRCSIVFTSKFAQSSASIPPLKFTSGVEPKGAAAIAPASLPNEAGSKESAAQLQALFELSQGKRFARFSTGISGVLRGTDFQEISAILKNSEYARSAKRQQMGGFSVVASFGCVEFQQGKFSSMVKMPWSRAQFYCDDFPED